MNEKGTFETRNTKLMLYQLLNEGNAAIKNRKKRPLSEVMQDIRKEISGSQPQERTV